MALRVATLADDDVRRRRIATTLERSGYVSEATVSSVDDLVLVDSSFDAVVVAADDLAEIADVLDGAKGLAAVIAVVTTASPGDIERAVIGGAGGVVLEDSDFEEVLALAVRLVSLGHIVLPEVFRDKAAKPVFSAREKEILSMVVLGFRNVEIARRLYLSESTVKTHLSAAFRKLGVQSRKAATTAILDPGSGFGYGILGITKDSEAVNRPPIGEPLPRAKLLTSRLRMPAHVVHRSFIRETVILNVRSGTYHKVNATGGRMLEVLDRSASVEAAVIELAAEYEKPVEEIEDDICEFSTDLIGRRLLEVSA
jgi:DNA-binding NarL/FixJ family response regulator